MRKLRHRGIKVTQLVGSRARIQGSLDPKAMPFTTLPSLTRFLGGSPSSGLTLAPEVGVRPRPGDLVSHSWGLSDWCRSAGTLPQDSPARASGNKGLSLSRKVAEPPGNGASTDGRVGLERQDPEDRAEPRVQPHLAAVLVGNPLT